MILRASPPSGAGLSRAPLRCGPFGTAFGPLPIPDARGAVASCRGCPDHPWPGSGAVAPAGRARPCGVLCPHANRATGPAPRGLTLEPGTTACTGANAASCRLRRAPPMSSGGGALVGSYQPSRAPPPRPPPRLCPGTPRRIGVDPRGWGQRGVPLRLATTPGARLSPPCRLQGRAGSTSRHARGRGAHDAVARVRGGPAGDVIGETRNRRLATPPGPRAEPAPASREPGRLPAGRRPGRGGGASSTSGEERRGADRRPLIVQGEARHIPEP